MSSHATARSIVELKHSCINFEVTLSMKTKVLRLLTELSSRKFISQLTGKFSKSSMSKFIIPRFIKAYDIPLEEAEKPLAEYASLNEFFTRRLKEGARPLDANELALLSPVDALITGLGVIESGQIFNVKGQDYSLEQLLNHSPRMVNYRNGYYFVLYLSPKDYHRIHAPATGTIIEKEQIRGNVYPVNDFALRRIPNVLSRNERLITYIQHSLGEIAVIKVGALNVSSIQYTDPQAKHIERGAELAYFEFGSTVVLLTESGTFACDDHLKVGERVRVGQALGIIQHK